MNDRVIVLVGRHDPRGRSRIHHLRYVLAAQIAEVLDDFLFREPGGTSHALISKDSLEFLQHKGLEQERVFRSRYQEQEQLPGGASGAGVRSHKDVRIENDPHLRLCRACWTASSIRTSRSEEHTS